MCPINPGVSPRYCSAPIGAQVISHGREPVVNGWSLFGKPQRGDGSYGLCYRHPSGVRGFAVAQSPTAYAVG